MAQQLATLNGLTIPKRSSDPIKKSAGLIYFNTTLGKYRFYNGSTWSTSTASAIFQLAASDETTALTVGTSKFTFRLPHALELSEVRASVGTAPTGASIIIDINKNGTTVLSTKLTIDATEKTSLSAAVATVISDSTFADDDEITIDIDQVGATIAGLALKVTLIGTEV